MSTGTGRLVPATLAALLQPGECLSTRADFCPGSSSRYLLAAGAPKAAASASIRPHWQLPVRQAADEAREIVDSSVTLMSRGRIKHF